MPVNGGTTMQEANKIDFQKLLGFAEVSDQLSGSFDFRDEAIDSKLGAKVGVEAMNEPSKDYKDWLF